jgi:hypothetical protein
MPFKSFRQNRNVSIPWLTVAFSMTNPNCSVKSRVCNHCLAKMEILISKYSRYWKECCVYVHISNVFKKWTRHIQTFEWMSSKIGQGIFKPQWQGMILDWKGTNQYKDFSVFWMPFLAPYVNDSKDETMLKKKQSITFIRELYCCWNLTRQIFSKNPLLRMLSPPYAVKN